MGLVLLAFDSSIAAGSVLVDCKSIVDAGVATQSGDGYVIDGRMKKLYGAWGFGANMTRVQVQTPLFNQLAYQEVVAINAAAAAAKGFDKVDLYGAGARALNSTETLIAQVIQSGGVAENDRVFLLVGDADPAPDARPHFTMRFTGTTTLSADLWSNVALTFDRNLPAGSYDIVGCRVKSAGALAWRIRPVGSAYAPGGPAVQSDLANDIAAYRHGGLGVLASFVNNLPPTIDLLSTSADTSESGEFDLVKTA